ncbi:ricin-type beta-trefoil lectin domain protein [Streptomyces canus]|uniref:ricin-type beta-trefoil lectin domain protein n=1 Tax=Streptomyces canus TaxID=58343 RepID=UPI0036E4763B
MSGKNSPQHEAAAQAAPEAAAALEPKETTTPGRPETRPEPAPEAPAPEATAPVNEAETGARAETETGAEAGTESAAESQDTAAVVTVADEKALAPRPFGRPSRGLLAGAAIAGALLIGVPFLLTGALDRSGPGGGTTDKAADAGTVLDDTATNADAGAYGSATPDPGPSSPSPSSGGNKDDAKNDKGGSKAGAVPAAGAGAGAVAQSTEEAEKRATKSKKTPTKATVTATVTTAPGTTIYSHASNRCIEMKSHKGSDGSPLQIANCNGKNYQKWDFRSDGTIRSMGLCMDVAWGSHDNGAMIQIAWCSGNPAQQFVLNGSNDLVNPQSNKCVDVKDQLTGAGTPLQLWDCNGQDNQKWSTR